MLYAYIMSGKIKKKLSIVCFWGTVSGSQVGRETLHRPFRTFWILYHMGVSFNSKEEKEFKRKKSS